MILGAVFCLSLSTLGYELLLTRYFSLAHGNALSFLVISIAMFGFAAGGTFTSLAGRRWLDAAGTAGRAVFPALSLLCALSTVGSFLLAKRIPLDYLRFPVDRLQALYLVASYLLLALPFFFCGLASCTAYSIGSARSGAVAFSSLLGSGAGALLPLLALPVLGEGACVAAAAAVPLIPPLIARRSPLPVRGVSAALLCCLAALAAWQGNGLLAVDPSPYKTLPQLLQAPGTVVTSRSTGILGRVEEVEGPSVRFLPGLSLGYTGPLPAQSAIVVDGDALNIVYALGDAAGSAAFARATHSFAAYVLAGAPGSSLVLQNDGGLALACAAASGGGDITLVVRNPEVARLLRKAYRLSGLAVEADDPRAFVARAGRTWDVIAVEGWGAALPGMASLTEDASLTVDAFRALWRRTADSGVITVSRRLLLPPSDSVRIFGSALGALREEGVRDPETRLAVIRGWGTCTLLVSKAAIGGSARERLVTFAGSMGFDLDYYSGIALEDTNRFNRFDRSYFAEAYLGILGDPGFLAEYPLDVAPQGDGRPFPGRFLRWGRVRDFYRLTGERAYTLFLSGEVVAAAALGEAALACILLLVLPVLARAGRPRGPGTARCLLYFAAAGLGFLLAEMCLIDSLGLLFSGPSVTLAVVLCGLLASSAAGGLASDRLHASALRGAVAAAALAVLLLAVLLPWIVRAALSLPLGLRVATALLAAGVPGFLLGTPFPAGMRLLAGSGPHRAYGWALNGCASVVASIASALIAPSMGWRMLGFAAAAAYAGASILAPGARAGREG